VDNVIVVRAEQFSDAFAFENRPTSLLGEQRREPTISTAEPIRRNVRVVRESHFRRFGMEQVIRIETMNDIDVMACISERVRQTIEKHGVTAETVRRVKGREMQKLERTTHWSALSS